MKNSLKKQVDCLVYLYLILFPLFGYSQISNINLLNQEFNLSGNHSQEIQFFELESKMVTLALDGKRMGTDIFRLHLKYFPAKNSGKELEKYTCIRFTLQLSASPEVEIPGLANWTYILNDTVGNKKGQVAFGIDKGADVSIAVNKAVNMAKKNIIEVPIVNGTIPHEIYQKVGAAKILLKPARRGKGVIAGGAARVVLEMAGIHNVTSKILGTNNKVNIVRSVIEALDNLKKVEKKKEDIKKEEKKKEKPENKKNKK